MEVEACVLSSVHMRGWMVPRHLRSIEVGAGVRNSVQWMNRRLGPRPLRSMEVGPGVRSGMQRMNRRL
eukprot:823597-Pleurochrysis_carterae.AAC.1